MSESNGTIFRTVGAMIESEALHRGEARLRSPGRAVRVWPGGSSRNDWLVTCSSSSTADVGGDEGFDAVSESSCCLSERRTQREARSWQQRVVGHRS